LVGCRPGPPPRRHGRGSWSEKLDRKIGSVFVSNFLINLMIQFCFQFFDPIFWGAPLQRNALKNWNGKLDRKLERKIGSEIGTPISDNWVGNWSAQLLDPISGVNLGQPASQRGARRASCAPGQQVLSTSRAPSQPAIGWYCSAPRSNFCALPPIREQRTPPRLDTQLLYNVRVDICTHTCQAQPRLVL